MKNPKIFLLLIFIISFIFLLIDLPQIRIGNFSSPNFSNLNINLGKIQMKKEIAYRLGLDLQGGTKLTYRVNMTNIPKDERDNAFESARNIIEKRINFFGVTEPTIQTLKLSNDYRIVIELPGMSDVSQAVDLIGKTAQLSFWETGPTLESTPAASLYPLGMTEILGNNPIKTRLTGGDLKSAKVGFNQNTGKPEVQLNFSPEGTKLFADITKRNVEKPVVIVLDYQIIEAPRVNEPILNGSAVITGSFTTQTAKNLAIQLNAGALPAPLEVIAQSSVGPSLGMDSLKKSLLGGLIGFLSIIIFMVYLYRKEGALASIALIIYASIVLFIFKIIPVTLTLAGIAGFILSVGMAVDANILIFERMKEERRQGKNRDAIIRLGFSRAWPSIRDSNIASIITSIILIYFGTGIVRGFALTLLIGILISMFSAILVTRSLLLVFDSGMKK